MRQCGECSLCCKLVPVKALHKIFAPPMVSDHEWHVVRHGTEAPEHSTEEIVTKLAQIGRVR
jgi:hypothetical protein